MRDQVALKSVAMDTRIPWWLWLDKQPELA